MEEVHQVSKSCLEFPNVKFSWIEDEKVTKKAFKITDVDDLGDTEFSQRSQRASEEETRSRARRPAPGRRACGGRTRGPRGCTSGATWTSTEAVKLGPTSFLAA